MIDYEKHGMPGPLPVSNDARLARLIARCVSVFEGKCDDPIRMLSSMLLALANDGIKSSDVELVARNVLNLEGDDVALFVKLVNADD